MSVEKIIGLIEQEIINSAVHGIQTPREHTEYELGRLAGMNEGLNRALMLVNQAITEEETEDHAPFSAGMSRPRLKRVLE